MSDTTDIFDIIHHSSLELLKSPGVRLHDREILEQLKKHGARIENDMAMFTEAQVMGSLSSAPKSFSLNSANSDRSLVIGGNSRCMAGSFGAPFIVTPDHRKRQATFDDFIRVAKLIHATELIQINGGILVQPNEIDLGMDKLLMVRAALALSDKPLLGIQGSYREVRQVGPGGEFLTHVHTMKHCRSEPYVSQLAPIKNDNPLQYLTDLESNLKMSLHRLEQAYGKPDLDQTLQRDMDVYMAGCGVPAAFLEKIV